MFQSALLTLALSSLVLPSQAKAREVPVKPYLATIAAAVKDVPLPPECGFRGKKTACGIVLDALAGYAINHVCYPAAWYETASEQRGVGIAGNLNAAYLNIRGCVFPIVKELSADKTQRMFNALSKHAPAEIDPIDDVEQCDWQIDTQCSIVLDALWILSETGKCVSDKWYADRAIHRNTPNPAESKHAYEIEGCMFPVVPFLTDSSIQIVFDQISK